jgi:hypothetical protein
MFSSLFGGRIRPRGLLALTLAVGTGMGCSTRDRPSFPTGGGTDLVGPSTTIDEPSTDTTVIAGPGVFINGRTLDQDGIDTIYVQTEGGITAFPPFVDVGTVFRFGLPITTNGQSGQTITVRIFGTDRLGNRGDTATRQITVQ